MPPKKRARIQDIGEDNDVVFAEYTHSYTSRGLKVREKLGHIPTPNMQMPHVEMNDSTAGESSDIYQTGDSTTMEPNVDIDFTVPTGRENRRTKSQNDYLREFQEQKDRLLECLLSTYSKPARAACFDCNQNQGIYRCKDCRQGWILCHMCCRKFHEWMPLHRIEKWSGKYFARAYLWQVGCRLIVPAPGGICAEMEQRLAEISNFETNIDNEESRNGTPEHANDSQHEQEFVLNAFNDLDSDYLDSTPENLQDEDPGDDETWDTGFDAGHGLGGVPREDGFGNDFVTVVDTSGIHSIPLLICHCRPTAEHVQHCLASGLFPTSFKVIATLFTTACLDDFRLANLECKTTNYQFHNFLRRKTNSAFPHAVPNRYAELRRLSRQWRILKKEKWHGLWKSGPPDDIVDPQPLGIFCAACPQPGINLPDDWESDPNRTLYTRVFTADGNFSADHLRLKGRDDDVWLLDGRGMITERKNYGIHLLIAKDEKAHVSCNHNYRTVGLANAAHENCDATGVGSVSCGRHGCFAPGATPITAVLMYHISLIA